MYNFCKTIDLQALEALSNNQSLNKFVYDKDKRNKSNKF